MFDSLYFNLGLGALVGIYGSLVGVGGGFLLVPVFLLLHGLPSATAAGTSLAIVTLNAVSGSVAYWRGRSLDLREGLLFALATGPGAVLGAKAVVLFPDKEFSRAFGVLLVLLALYLFFRKIVERAPFLGKTGFGWKRRVIGSKEYEVHEPTGMGLSLFVGFFSSLFGLGGGIFHVPILTVLLRFPVHVAVATSQFVLAFTAFVGALAHAASGHVDFRLALTTGLGAVAGAQIGARLAPKFRGSTLIKALSVGLVIVGLRLLF